LFQNPYLNIDYVRGYILNYKARGELMVGKVHDLGVILNLNLKELRAYIGYNIIKKSRKEKANVTFKGFIQNLTTIVDYMTKANGYCICSILLILKSVWYLASL
jgi:hypothetical protein